MKRLIFVAIAFLVGCSGMGSGTSRFLPVGSNAAQNALAARSGAAGPLVGADAIHRGRKIPVKLSLTIPRHRRGRAIEAHPSTISPSTMSVSIAINGGHPQNFNTTPTSSNCSVGAIGTVCTFSVSAPVGSDTFSVSTYNAVGGSGGTGTVLDSGIAVIDIVAGKNNTASVRLGPVASSTADSGPGSLRYAVGTAAAGETVMVMLPAGSTITLASPITISNAVSIAGPGVTASARTAGDKHPETTYSGVTISGGGAVQIFVINAGATVTISGLILTQGSATTSAQPGGALYNGGSTNLASDVFVNNTSTVHSPYIRHTGKKHHVHHEPRTAHHKPERVVAALRAHCVDTDAYGGAVYNHGGMTITGSTFDSNFVSNTSCGDGYGGAVYNDYYGVLASSGNTYVNNSAYEGGAVYNNAYYGQGTFTGDLFNGNQGCNTVSGCPTSGCTPGGGCSSYAEGYGAAIYDDEGQGVTITNSTFENNVDGGNSPDSYGEGGALYLDTGSPIVNGSTFTNNIAGGGTTNCSNGYAAAIYLDSDYTLQLNNDTFSGNQAGGDEEGYGGALYAYEPVSGSNDSFTNNKAFGTGSICYSDGYGYGGAIYTDSTDAEVSLNTVSFTGNLATGAEEGYGGAVYAYGNSAFINSTFTQNAAIGTGITGEYTYGYGGAIYQDDDYLKVTNATFSSNSVQCLGPYDYYCYAGAVYDDGSGMTSSNTTYSSNACTATGGYDDPYCYAGAIYADEPLTSSGDTFTSNTVTSRYYGYAGAVYNDDTMTLSNDTFAGNSSGAGQYSYGGALYNDDDGYVNNTTFSGNSAPGLFGYGGAIYVDSTLYLNGGSVSGNSAKNYGGGGIYSDDDLYMSNTVISANTVTGATYEGGGGGFYNDDYAEITNSTISGNSVSGNALYVGGGGIWTDDTLSMTGSTVSGNSVTGATLQSTGGGGIFNYDYVEITNSTITGNTSSSDGGGLLNTWKNSEIYNVTAYQNTATGTGGNLYNESLSSTMATMYVGSSIFGGGTAATGPDVANTGTLTSEDYNVIQTAVAGTALAGTTTHNQTANPQLLALNNNGGPTFTNADQSGGPGVADIPFSGGECNFVSGTGVDQRGFTRGAGGRCDVGAFELSGTPSAVRVHAAKVRPHHDHPMRARPPHPGVRKKPGSH